MFCQGKYVGVDLGVFKNWGPPSLPRKYYTILEIDAFKPGALIFGNLKATSIWCLPTATIGRESGRDVRGWFMELDDARRGQMGTA